MPGWCLLFALLALQKLGTCTEVKPKNGHCLRMATAMLHVTLPVITGDAACHYLCYCLSLPVRLPVIACNTACHYLQDHLKLRRDQQCCPGMVDPPP